LCFQLTIYTYVCARTRQVLLVCIMVGTIWIGSSRYSHVYKIYISIVIMAYHDNVQLVYCHWQMGVRLFLSRCVCNWILLLNSTVSTPFPITHHFQSLPTIKLSFLSPKVIKISKTGIIMFNRSWRMSFESKFGHFHCSYWYKSENE
jgi:hypothetical protein